MGSKTDSRLAELGIELPPAPAPAANYVPWVRSGNLVFISGQVPLEDGKLAHVGKVGAKYDVDEAKACARLAGLNVLAVLREACDGDLDRVLRCVKLGGFVNCTPEFGEHPAVVNGASDLMVEVLGARGKHARFAVGAPALPFDVPVEVDAVFEVEGQA